MEKLKNAPFSGIFINTLRDGKINIIFKSKTFYNQNYDVFYKTHPDSCSK